MQRQTHLITASEAAYRLNVGVRTAIRWIEEGRMSAVEKLPTKRGAWLIDEQEVERVAKARRDEILARLPRVTSAPSPDSSDHTTSTPSSDGSAALAGSPEGVA
ncbi:DNA-binding protein [Actinomyces lilanjuaniae]|uniref:DNA-binding protein n=1 Tax=Actinomyces lilanjuaniae TaxID=2321394 RepID=A0ABN5PN04_9ACTO|nr:helix-turn-helix domain-containing protein [Actinomyces lilanjuaniae]AYD89699.1 DNA-binding protein [Actinomyces lilanjuaniae]